MPFDIDLWSFLLGYGVALLTCFFAVGLGSVMAEPERFDRPE